MKKQIAGIALLVVALIFVATLNFAFPTSAQTTSTSIVGWAWSSNIGWISFSSTNSTSDGGDYGITMDGNGVWSGYAWSDNIGWIKMNPDGPYPETPNSGVKLDGTNLKGWARACGVFQSGCLAPTKTILGTELGGWDGWIKMSGKWGNGANDSYGVSKLNDSDQFEGYAWGSDVIGWVNFSEVYNNGTVPAPVNPGTPGGGGGGSTGGIPAGCTGVCVASSAQVCPTGYTMGTSGTCVLNQAQTLAPSYSIIADPASIRLNYTAPNSKSTSTFISIIPLNGFNESVDLTVQNNVLASVLGNISCGGTLVDCYFKMPDGSIIKMTGTNKAVFTYADYNAGKKVEFYIIAKGQITGTKYTIGLHGISPNGVEATTSATSDITLTLKLINPVISPN